MLEFKIFKKNETFTPLNNILFCSNFMVQNYYNTSNLKFGQKRTLILTIIYGALVKKLNLKYFDI